MCTTHADIINADLLAFITTEQVDGVRSAGVRGEVSL
jgi:hypothetical protein